MAPKAKAAGLLNTVMTALNPTEGKTKEERYGPAATLFALVALTIVLLVTDPDNPAIDALLPVIVGTVGGAYIAYRGQ